MGAFAAAAVAGIAATRTQEDIGEPLSIVVDVLAAHVGRHATTEVRMRVSGHGQPVLGSWAQERQTSREETGTCKDDAWLSEACVRTQTEEGCFSNATGNNHLRLLADTAGDDGCVWRAHKLRPTCWAVNQLLLLLLWPRHGQGRVWVGEGVCVCVTFSMALARFVEI